MSALLVDSNILLDMFTDDLVWSEWSESMLARYSGTHSLYINSVIYSEISIGFARIEELEEVLAEGGIAMHPIPKEALFLAGKVFLQYRADANRAALPPACPFLRKNPQTRPLPRPSNTAAPHVHAH